MRLYKLNESNLSFVRSGMSDRRKRSFEEGMDQLDKHREAGELTQTEFKRMKELLAYGIEEAWSDLIRRPFYFGGEWENLPEDVRDVGDLNIGLHLIQSSLKKANKFPDHEVTRLAKRFLEELVDIADDVKDLKGKIVNKRQRASEEKQRQEAEKEKVYVASKDLDMVKEVLTRVTRQLRADLLEDNNDYLNKLVDRWKKQYDPKNRKTEPRTYYRNNSFSAHMVEKVTERRSSTSDGYALKPKYKDVLTKEAEEMTDSSIEHYISKNTSKLAQIVVKKKGLKEVELLRTHAGNGRIEGTMRLTFDDGSSFVVDSNLVQSYSVHGKPFLRYPTTFHNVKMPDGSKMRGKASEDRMKKEFAAKPGDSE